MMLSVLLGLCAFQVPDLDKALTLRQAAAPVSEVLAQVSKDVGFSFTASEVRDWPIIVSVKSLRAGELLERIAEVTDAEWRKERDRWVLTRTAVRVKRAADLENADRAERLKPVIDALPARMSPEDLLKAFAEARRDLQSGGGDGNTSRMITGGPSPALDLIYWALKRLPAKDLAAAPINSFVSYSSVPRPGQLALPPIPAEVWRRYLATRSEFAKAVEVPGHVTMPAGMAKLPLPPNVRVSLMLSRPNATADIYVALGVYDAEGLMLDLARFHLTLPPVPIESSESLASGPMVFSEESTRLLRALRRQNPPGKYNLPSTQPGEQIWISDVDPWLAEENLAVVRKAIEREPTAFHISDWLLSLSDKERLNVIAYVPDHAFGSLTDVMGGATPDHRLVWQSLPRFGIEAKISEGSLVVKPKMFARADRYRVNRAALRKFVAAAGPLGWPKLQDYMTYAMAAPPVTTSASMDNLLLGPILYRRNSELTDPARVMALRLLSQWRAQSPTGEVLRHGETVRRFGAVYEKFVRVSTAPQASYRTISSRREPLREEDLDPFALVLGEDTPVILEQIRHSEGALLLIESGAPQVLVPRTLGMYFGLKPENFTGFQPVRAVKRLHPAAIVKRSITFRAGRSGQLLEILDADIRTSETININQLPADWQEAFEEGKQHASNIQATQNTRATPPPE
ncbi:MAG: hypothetical protein IT363_00615 [Methanoregulaceae archaeon]|nr:hypothetical protein [Methanoregulaceae archaeon]